MRKIVSCEDYFATINERFVKKEADGVTATFVYELEGAGTWTVTVDQGNLSVATGTIENPTVTYKITASNYVDLANGDLGGAKAFLMRKLKVSGWIPMAQKMNKFLPPAS